MKALPTVRLLSIGHQMIAVAHELAIAVPAAIHPLTPVRRGRAFPIGLELAPTDTRPMLDYYPRQRLRIDQRAISDHMLAC